MPAVLLKASSYYPGSLEAFYRQDPDRSELAYEKQHAALMEESCGWSDAWRRHLEPGGRFKVIELVVNAEPMQKRWALENGARYRAEHWQEDIFLAQLEAHAPDVLFAHAPEVSLHLLAAARDRAGKKRLYTIAYDGVARHDERLLRHSDLVLTCVQRTVEYYTARGVKSWLFPYGFDPLIQQRVRARRAKPVDVSFIGSLAVRIGHQARARLLDEVSGRVALDVWFASVPSLAEVVRMQASFFRHAEWAEALAFPRCALSVRRLGARDRGPLFGLDMFAQLAASRVSLNIHIAAAGAEAANMRLFEATGMGTCLLTDWKPNLAELFEADREVVVFRSADEAVEKIKWLLANEDARAGIAERGQRRTLANYSTRGSILDFGLQLEKLMT